MAALIQCGLGPPRFRQRAVGGGANNRMRDQVIPDQGPPAPYPWWFNHARATVAVHCRAIPRTGTNPPRILQGVRDTLFHDWRYRTVSSQDPRSPAPPDPRQLRRGTENDYTTNTAGRLVPRSERQAGRLVIGGLVRQVARRQLKYSDVYAEEAAKKAAKESRRQKKAS